MVFKVFAVFALLGVLIISELSVRNVESGSGSTTEDVTIIGAGLGGTYAGYKLKDKNLKIGIYEMSDRIGGRYFSHRLRRIPDIIVELCAMRFIPDVHTRLMNLLEELGVPIADFEEKFGIPSKSRYYIRGQQIPFTEMGKPGYLPFNVKPWERLPPHELKYKFFKAITNTTDNSEPLYTLATRDGIPLYMQSHRQVLGKIASNEGYQYLKETAYFYNHFEDVIGLEARLNKPVEKPINCPDCYLPEVKKVVTGFQSVAETLLGKYVNASRRHVYHPNHRLIKIRKSDGRKIKLTFQKTVSRKGVTYDTNEFKTITTGKVILSLPREQLLYVDWKPLRDHNMRRELFDSVHPVKPVHIYLGYKYSWWKTIGANFTYACTDLTIGNLYNWDVSKSGKGVLLVAATDKHVDIWKRLQGQGRVVGGSSNGVVDVTEEVVKQVHRDLAELYELDVTRIPNAIDGAMLVYSNEFPHLAGYHRPSPGYKLEEIRTSVLKPSCTENVFIASSSYSSPDLQGWSEGTLQVQNDVLDVLFKQGTVHPCKHF